MVQGNRIGHVFSSGSRTCDLCLKEKLIILTEEKETMLNKRDELLETCRHRRKHLLVSIENGTVTPLNGNSIQGNLKTFFLNHLTLVTLKSLNSS